MRDDSRPMGRRKASNSKKRITAESKKNRDSNLAGDSSAHPNAANYDPTYARTIMGDLAEEIRQWLAKNYDARPPGLDTRWEEDSGNMLVVADCPDEGLGLEVEIRPLGGGGPGAMPGAAGAPPVMNEGMPPDPAAGIGPDMGAMTGPPDSSAVPPPPPPGPPAGIGPAPMDSGLPPSTPGPATGPQIGPAPM